MAYMGWEGHGREWEGWEGWEEAPKRYLGLPTKGTSLDLASHT